MERDIDMGQTIEEAARIERERIILELHADYKIHGDARHYVISSTVIGKYGVNLFKAGAEWQAKQSSWINVKERLPKENEMVLCRMVSNGAIVLGYIVVEAGKPPRVATSGNFEFEDYGDYECDMWMPIPDLGE